MMVPRWYRSTLIKQRGGNLVASRQMPERRSCETVTEKQQQPFVPRTFGFSRLGTTAALYDLLPDGASGSGLAEK
jgi:hypothetical protein